MCRRAAAHLGMERSDLIRVIRVIGVHTVTTLPAEWPLRRIEHPSSKFNKPDPLKHRIFTDRSLRRIGLHSREERSVLSDVIRVIVVQHVTTFPSEWPPRRDSDRDA